MPHDFAGQGAAAGGIDADDDGFDLVVAAGFADGLAEILGADVIAVAHEALIGGAVDDHALGVNDGDAVPGRSDGLVREEREDREGAGEIDLLARVFAVMMKEINLLAQFIGQELAKLIHFHQVIDQPVLFGVGGGDHGLIDELLNVGKGELSADADGVDDLAVEGVGEFVQFTGQFGAGLGAGVFLVGAFVFADLHVIGGDADFIEQSLGEHGFKTDAGDHDLAPLHHTDVGGAAGGDVTGSVEFIGIDEGAFAVLGKGGQFGAEFHGLGKIQPVVAEGDEDGADFRIVACLFEAVDEDAQGQAAVGIGKERKIGGFFGDRIGEIEIGDLRSRLFLNAAGFHAGDEFLGRGEEAGGRLGGGGVLIREGGAGRAGKIEAQCAQRDQR